MNILRLFTALCLSLWLSTAVAAQESINTDFERWDGLASQAEDMVDAGSATDDTFEATRNRIAEYRTDFDAARSLNASRIAILREQIAALGAPPEGENAPEEAPDVAAKRKELTEQLNKLLAPVQRAEAEFLRADALVGQIDSILRDRQTEQLLSVSPSPLNPAHWPVAIAELMTAIDQLWNENRDKDGNLNFALNPSQLPKIVLPALLGLVLILRGRRWSAMLVGSLHRYGARGFGIWRFLLSLLRIILPFAGLCLLAMAGTQAGFFGPRGNQLLIVLAGSGGVMLGFRWVADRVFARDEDEALVALEAPKRKQVRLYVGVITVMIIVSQLVVTVLEGVETAKATVPVLLFPMMLVSALALYRIGMILRSFRETKPVVDPEKDEEPRQSSLSRIVRALGTGAMAVAVVAPLMYAVGYFSAAQGLLPPYIVTLVLLGLVMALQRFGADIYGAMTGQGAQARDALMPVLIGMVLFILALPLLALAWGARVNDLTELWALIGRGFSIGESRISPRDFVTFAVIFVIGYVVTRAVQGALRTNVLPKTKLDIGGQNAIVSGLGYVGIFLAALAAITGAGIDLSSLAIVAGALSVGIGFGLQNIVSNFVSGIILLIERPISEGDWIEVGGQMGYVRDISVRSTRIETFDRSDVIVPNADLVSGTVTNYTRGNTVGRLIVQVGVAYGTDTRKVDAILREIAADQPMVLAAPPPNVLFTGFGADSLDFEIRCILRDVNWMMQVKSDVNHVIAERFAAEGIEIPFAQRDVWLRNPETLATGAGEA